MTSLKAFSTTVDLPRKQTSQRPGEWNRSCSPKPKRRESTHRSRLPGSSTCGISWHRGKQVSWRLFPDLALIVLAAIDASFAQDGMRPHRINEGTRIGSFGCWRMTGTGCVGAMLYRGLQSSSPETLSKCSSMICFRSRKSVAAAHGEIMADRIASRLWGCDQTAFPALAVLYRSRSLRVDLPALGITRSDRFVCLDCFGTPAESNPKT